MPSIEVLPNYSDEDFIQSGILKQDEQGKTKLNISHIEDYIQV